MVTKWPEANSPTTEQESLITEKSLLLAPLLAVAPRTVTLYEYVNKQQDLTTQWKCVSAL